MTNPFRRHWALHPDVDFLNHGSFGATPIRVLEAQREWILRLEREPIEFLAPERTLLPKLERVRQSVAQLLNVPSEDIAFVRNATEGVSAVMRSFPLAAGDEVLITSHGYNACNNAVRFAANQAGASVVVAEIPFPIRSASQVIDAIDAKLTARTRLLLIDHVTSPTGLILPIDDIVQLVQRRGVRVMVDGAHAPGMLPVDLQTIGADYYTANHHKWLCGPKTSGLLYVRPEWQSEVHPTTISHGATADGYGSSRFLAEFNWIGTYDPSPLLALPTALEFLNELYDGGMRALMAANRSLALAGRDVLLERLGVEQPAPIEMIGSLATVPLPGFDGATADQLRSLQRQLYERHRIEVPIFQLGGQHACLRISAQAYNTLDQYQRLADALLE